MRSLSGRLLPLLQLTRMALVFTAIADTQCELLLSWQRIEGNLTDHPGLIVAIVLISVGLYGFGMSLNDIIDRRRDAQIAATRPLPSGRIGIVTAHVISFFLATLAVAAGAYYFRHAPQHGPLSLILVVLTGALIAFYDIAGKYLVGLGLLSLGLIRFFHCVIPAPELPVLWHPLLLLNHVAILSTVAYYLEEKRPALTKLHWWGVLGGLGFLDALVITVIAWRRRHFGSLPDALSLRPGLAIPAAAVLLYLALAFWIYRRSATRRAAGQKLMLYGLLWLIAYDAAFVAAYVDPWWSGLLLLALLPLAYLAVQFMRVWAQMLILSQKPRYHRAGVDDAPRPERPSRTAKP
jgi:4-hydroxybenzoate polyprenyltransferase